MCSSDLLTEFEASDPSPAPAPSPPAPALGPYRRVNVSRKRKSNVSHLVAGANLRRKRRRLQVDDAASQSAASLDRQYLEESFRDEIRKKEYFQYFSRMTKEWSLFTG